MSEERKLIHRDDIDAETMQGFEAKFAEMYPGFKVVCVGDSQGELPPHLAEVVEAIEAKHVQSLLIGTCLDCGKQMPDYPKRTEDMSDNWKPAEGWRWFTDMATGEISAWQCPECDQAEEPEERP